MVVQTAFQRWLLATVLILTMLAGACTNANATAPSVVLGTATPIATQTLRVSETLRVFTPTPGPTATQIQLATPVPESAVPLPTPDPTLLAGLIGLWQGDNGSFYLFNNDGTWNWDQTLARVESTPEKRGRWWITADYLFIQDLIGKDTYDMFGPYLAHLVGDTLSLTRAGDLNAVRLTQTEGKYTRLPAGP